MSHKRGLLEEKEYICVFVWWCQHSWPPAVDPMMQPSAGSDLNSSHRGEVSAFFSCPL